MKFIVVDDNKTFREGIKYYLENILYHEVIGMAEDGEQFLQIENKPEADIILMDIEMPIINGVEAAKRGLWENNTYKFIAVTSYKDKAYLTDLIFAGFKACIFKDYFYDEFEETVSKVFNDNIHFPQEIILEQRTTQNKKQ